MAGVTRITILPNLSDANTDLWGNRVPAAAAPYYQLLEAPKHEVKAEDRLVSVRLEPPSEVVPEKSSNVLVVVAGPDQRRHVRSILAPKMCKALMWLQVVSTALICLIWCVNQMKKYGI